jgi:hypothetical protein
MSVALTQRPGQTIMITRALLPQNFMLLQLG